MRKGFTKIPNTILEQSWANNPVIVYLYTWLSLNADKDGVVSLSLNELVTLTGLNKMQVRRAIDKLKSTGYVTQIVTQLATQKATHLPNKLSICFLSTCKSEKTDTDTTCDTTSDTVSDTLSCAYKNDNINIMSIEEDYKDKNKSSLRSDLQKENDEVERFKNWMKENFPFVVKMQRPLTINEYKKLAIDYTNNEIAKKLGDMDNTAGICKKYTSAYKTLLNWLKREYGERHAPTP